MRVITLGLLSASILAGCAGERRPADSPENSQTGYVEESTTVTETYSLTPGESVAGTDESARQSSLNQPSDTADDNAVDTRIGSARTNAPDMDDATDVEQTSGSNTDAVDAQSGELTAPDQLENRSDLDITQQIRQAVMDDGSLSFAAKNAQIITRNGQVTLKGNVESEAERSAIVAAARKVAGAGRVDNQLTVNK